MLDFVKPSEPRPGPVRLTEKQRKFASSVADGMRLNAAYRAAYATKAGDKVVSVSANELMRNPKIMAAIKAEMALKLNQSNHEHAHADAKQFLLAQLIETCRNCQDQSLRLKALELLAASMGIFVSRPDANTLAYPMTAAVATTTITAPGARLST